MTAQTIVPAVRGATAACPITVPQAKNDRRRGDGFTRDQRSGRWGAIAAGARASVALLLSLAIVACATASAPHIGKTARPENRLPLSELSRTETTWTAKDLKLHYLAAQAGDNLEISGFVEFGSNLAKYPVINAFRVYLHYLDAEGLVLDSKLLWSTGVNNEYRFVRWTFERQWPVPPPATAVGFSYRGGASEAGGDKGFGQTKTGWEVYQAP